MTSELQREQKQQQKQMWGAASDAWERHDPFFDRQTRALTEWMLREARLAPGMRVLDLACGTGYPALPAAQQVGPDGSVVATDLAPQMVDVATRRARALGIDNVEIREMDLEDIQFADETFDAATCRFGLMFCPDPNRGAAEIRRVLRPGGRVVLTVWGDPAQNPFLTTIGRVLAEELGLPPPDPTAPGLFRLAPPGELESVLRAAGFAEIRTEPLPMSFDFESAEEYWAIQTELAAPLRAAVARLAAPEVARLRDKVIASVTRFADAGRIRIGAMPLGAVAVR
jgi:enediyne biosynthesis protein CalE5